jgi:hypothetical protein
MGPASHHSTHRVLTGAALIPVCSCRDDGVFGRFRELVWVDRSGLVLTTDARNAPKRS